jgi:hypothetical protein
MPRILYPFLLLPAACYASHERPNEGGVDAGIDGGAFDAHVPFDVGPDARLPDAGMDAGLFDAAEPPIEPPPIPARCRTTPPIAPFSDPVLEYEWPDGDVVHADAIHVCSTPLVIDLTPGDTIEPVIVFVSYPPLGRDEPAGVLRIVDPRTNTTISHPAEEAGEGVLEATGNLAAGDLDGDGTNEIVGIGRRAGTYAFRHDGTLFWASSYPNARERGSTDLSASIGAAITLADLEGDGTIEVLVGRTVLEGLTGRRRWTGEGITGLGRQGILGPISCAADLDGDGIQEVIAGHTAFRTDGTIFWNNPTALDGFCAVADVDPDIAGPEVVLVSSGYVRLLNGRTGEVVWLRNLEGRAGASLGGAPTVADFDGDGDVEFGVAHGAAYGVYDPSCEGTPLPEGCQAEGLRWLDLSTSDDSSSATGSSVFDFNGDGRAEVIYNDQYYFRVYDGTTGDEVFRHRNSSRTRTENPTIADVDNDGDVEIVFSANAEAFFIRERWTDPGIEVWGDARGRWVGARRIWNQHAYHITNVEEDGTIASPETDSWTVLNAYRQNLRQDGDVLATPDLWGGRGELRCAGGGRAILRFHVRNFGLERVGAGVTVALYRGYPFGERIAEAETTRTLEGGGDGEFIEFEVDLGSMPTTFYAMLDDPLMPAGGAVAECLETNNQVLVWQASCP